MDFWNSNELANPLKKNLLKQQLGEKNFGKESKDHGESIEL